VKAIKTTDLRKRAKVMTPILSSVKSADWKDNLHRPSCTSCFGKRGGARRRTTLKIRSWFFKGNPTEEVRLKKRKEFTKRYLARRGEEGRQEKAAWAD